MATSFTKYFRTDIMSKEHLRKFLGFGVAGNFAHHLEQAGEAADFVDVKVECERAPKGMFPFYLPGSTTFLGTYPLSSSHITHPRTEEGNLQMEPEVALICEMLYEEGRVIDILPSFFTAYNDCSIRKEGAKKISEKKNWGEATKGISPDIIPIDRFEHGGTMDNYRIASFLKRNGTLHVYGEDSPVLGYNYFYGELKTWMIAKLNEQQDSGPLEDLHNLINQCGSPEGAIISIGATSYTAFGESTFLEIGDELFIYLYDGTLYDFEAIERDAKNGGSEKLAAVSRLHQKVV
jgi:hypothetical protein